MLSMDRQRQVQEKLRQLDEALTADAALEEAAQKQGHALREHLFGAFQFIERESLQYRTLLVQNKRIEANQLQVQVQGRPPLAILLDGELAHDYRVVPQPGQAPGKSEPAARCYALFAPPYRGMLRHYTVFSTGEWRRTVFLSRGGSTQVHSTLHSATSLELMVEEASDLLAQMCAVHSSWSALSDDPGAIMLDHLRDRAFTRRDPLGLG